MLRFVWTALITIFDFPYYTIIIITHLSLCPFSLSLHDQWWCHLQRLVHIHRRGQQRLFTHHNLVHHRLERLGQSHARPVRNLDKDNIILGYKLHDLPVKFTALLIKDVTLGSNQDAGHRLGPATLAERFTKFGTCL